MGWCCRKLRPESPSRRSGLPPSPNSPWPPVCARWPSARSSLGWANVDMSSTAEEPPMLKLQIIVGSTRPDRAADHVLPWVLDRAQRHDGFEVELLDLRDWPLPMFQEHAGTIG